MEPGFKARLSDCPVGLIGLGLMGKSIARNILKAGIVGRLVANVFSGAIVSAELMEFDPNTGQRLDFIAVAEEIERRVRQKFDTDHVSESQLEVVVR